MEVYLVQHAEAKSKKVDPERLLTEEGRWNIQRVAAFAAELGVEAIQIRHSGKARAEQTATILGRALSPSEGVVAVAGLAPLDDVMPVADELNRASQPLMLVGHLPFMERLAGKLLINDAEQPVVKFRNAAIVSLVRTEERWQVAWILTPEMASV